MYQASGKKYKNGIAEKKKEPHDKAVDDIFNDLDFLEIDPKKVIFKEKFPKNYQNKEIGDLIFIEDAANELKVTVLEVTFGGGRKIKKDCKKLRRCKEYFLTERSREYFFAENNIACQNHSKIIFLGLIASFEGKWRYEDPLISQIIKASAPL